MGFLIKLIREGKKKLLSFSEALEGLPVEELQPVVTLLFLFYSPAHKEPIKQLSSGGGGQGKCCLGSPVFLCSRARSPQGEVLFCSCRKGAGALASAVGRQPLDHGWQHNKTHFSLPLL